MGNRRVLRDLPKRAVVLLSGGIDSVTTLYYALNQGYQIRALGFDYCQRHKKELSFAQKIANSTHTPYSIVKISLPWAKSSLTQPKLTVPINRDLDSKDIPVTYVSGRNIIFLSYAVSFAESIGADTVFIGAHIQDYSGYPDCRPQFLKSFETAAANGLANNKIKIKAPLLYKTKKQIIQLGLKLKVPFGLTWSCYNGQKYPCKECDSCRYRAGAFKKLGVKDSHGR